MKGLFAKKTVKYRHQIVKLLAPKLYNSSLVRVWVSNVPRPSTVVAKTFFGDKPIKVVEIGVEKGVNAENILKTFNIVKFYAIDPYIPYRENNNFIDPSQSEAEAKNRLKHFPQVMWIRKKSVEAWKYIAKPVDFVYIDGNHSYLNVLEDLYYYYPLVENGIIAGHDIHYPSVYNALNKFVRDNHINYYLMFPDWMMFK